MVCSQPASCNERGTACGRRLRSRPEPRESEPRLHVADASPPRADDPLRGRLRRSVRQVLDRRSTLGLEPPLAREGERAPPDRRSVSVRWLSGTILTGLFGAALIGSAIWVSLDGRSPSPSAASSRSRPPPRPAGGERSPRRGDRLFTHTDIVSAKQAFKTPTTIRVGDREVIKIKPFVRVATNLALGSLGFRG